MGGCVSCGCVGYLGVCEKDGLFVGVNAIIVGDAHDILIQAIHKGLSSVSVTCHLCADVFEGAAALPAHQPVGLLVGTEQDLMDQQGAFITLAVNEGWHCVVWQQAPKTTAALGLWTRSQERISLVQSVGEILLIARECLVQRVSEQDPVRPEFFANAEEISALLGPMDDE